MVHQQAVADGEKTSAGQSETTGERFAGEWHDFVLEMPETYGDML